MKIRIAFFCFLYSIIVTAQSYDFDLKCVESSTRLKPKIGNENSWKSYIYFNSENNKYYLQELQDGSRFLYDNELKEIFYFSLIKDKNPYYTMSKQEKMDFGYVEKDISKVTIEKIDEYEYLVKTFPRMKSRRSNREVKFKLTKAKSPLVQIRFMDLSPSTHQSIYYSLLDKLENQNYRIESAEVDYRSGYKFIYDFSQCEEKKLKIKFKE